VTGKGDLLRMEDIVKIYPNGVLANDRVQFSVCPGEIHALVGENGAGKTTLMKILCGMETANSGRILFDGKERCFRNSKDAIAAGIGMVYQHFKLISDMSVAENIVLGWEPQWGPFLDTQKAAHIARELSEKYNLELDPEAKVKDLTVGQKQKVEILKVLLREALLIVLDEPSAVLTPQETETLFDKLRLLKDAGHTVVFISHKIDEILRICNRITVLREAKTAGVYDAAAVNGEMLAKAIIGCDLPPQNKKNASAPGAACLVVEDLTVYGKGRAAVNGVSFTLHRGEILGVAGIEGNGQAALVKGLMGLVRSRARRMELCGESMEGCGIPYLRRMGVAYIPEDRMVLGGAAELSVEENLIADKFRTPVFSAGVFLRREAIAAYGVKMIGEYGIKCASGKQRLGMLSGGNIQKVVAAREFSALPRFLIAEQPTRGIDVGAARTIHEKLGSLRDAGCAILLVSADISEILAVSDRVIVFFNGCIVARFSAGEIPALTEQELGLYMLGVKQREEKT
jgi:simple sugar transport system ATP-binding protein